jgi:hypothetical protein
MSRGIEALELERAPDAYNISLTQAPVDASDATGCAGVREYLRPGGPYEPLVAPGVIEVLVRVEDLGNGPALLKRRVEAEAPLEGVYGQGFAAFRASDEVMKVSVGVCRPDSLNQHNGFFPPE